MKLENAVRLVLGVAFIFSAQMQSASATSCVDTTLAVSQCPPQDEHPNPEWPFPDTAPPGSDGWWGDYLVPEVPGNPYPVTCSSSVEDKVRSARYAVSYFVAYMDAQNGAHYDYQPNTRFYIRYADGLYQIFVDEGAYSTWSPVDPNNIVLNVPAGSCATPSQQQLPWNTYCAISGATTHCF